MGFSITLDDQDRAAAEKTVARNYLESVIAHNSLLHFMGNLSKTFIGRTIIAGAALAVGAAIAPVAMPGVAIVGAGFSAALMVAYSRNKARELEFMISDTITDKKKSGAFDQNVRIEMVMMAEQQMRLRSELGGDVVSHDKAAMDAGAAFNGSTMRSPNTGLPLTGGSPEVLAAMRMR